MMNCRTPATALATGVSTFASIPEAAVADERVDFRDNDPADNAACTESFAATALRHSLAVCAKLDEADVRFALSDRLPPEGDVFVLGSRNSNPLISQVDPHAGAAKAHRICCPRPEGAYS